MVWTLVSLTSFQYSAVPPPYAGTNAQSILVYLHGVKVVIQPHVFISSDVRGSHCALSAEPMVMAEPRQRVDVHVMMTVVL